MSNIIALVAVIVSIAAFIWGIINSNKSSEAQKKVDSETLELRHEQAQTSEATSKLEQQQTELRAKQADFDRHRQLFDAFQLVANRSIIEAMKHPQDEGNAEYLVNAVMQCTAQLKYVLASVDKGTTDLDPFATRPPVAAVLTIDGVLQREVPDKFEDPTTSKLYGESMDFITASAGQLNIGPELETNLKEAKKGWTRNATPNSDVQRLTRRIFNEFVDQGNQISGDPDSKPDKDARTQPVKADMANRYGVNTIYISQGKGQGLTFTRSDGSGFYISGDSAGVFPNLRVYPQFRKFTGNQRTALYWQDHFEELMTILGQCLINPEDH